MIVEGRPTITAPALPPVLDTPALVIVRNHVCPVVDLFDSFVAVRGETVVGTWPVDARGQR